MSLDEIAGFRLVSADAARLAAFYAALGFQVGAEWPIKPDEMRALGLEGRGLRRALRLGPTAVEIDSFDAPGRRYPADADAADLIFQHLALVTDDAHAAWGRAEAAGARPISRDGPVALPASAGGVTAVKFRDPEGHPLEFLQFALGARPEWSGQGVLGVDHSAISVADAEASRRFYQAQGLALRPGSLNHGPTQAALDGLDRVEVEVVPLKPASHPPHVELLAYRRPRGRAHPPLAANDVAATRIVWRGAERTLLRDPDGHLHELAPG